MNSENGQIYRGTIEVEAARLRGEPIVPISEQAADKIEAGYACMNRAERRLAERRARRANKARTQ